MKNLEAEYRNSQQEETPDLWNRIEAALPEKAPLAGQMQQSPAVLQSVVSGGVTVQQQAIPMPTQTSKKKIISFVRFTKVAAAVLVLALVVPGAWLLMTQGNNGVKNDSASAMDTAGNSTGMDMAEDYELPAADAAAPEAMENSAVPENTQGEKPQFDAVTDSAMQEAVGQSPMEDGVQSETVQSEAAQSQDVFFMTVEEMVYDHDRTFYYLSDESGTIYIAVWEEASVDAENIGAGENGSLGEITPSELQVGESYDFIMQEAVGKDWDYEILGVE